MRTSELKFYKNNIIDFCTQRGLIILKDIYKLPSISRKISFVQKAVEKFQDAVVLFKEKFPRLNDAIFFIDSPANMQNLIPSIAIGVVGSESFLVYDVILKRTYTYENNVILLDNQQICLDDVSESIQSNECESLQMCRYLAKLSKDVRLSEDSPFANFAKVANV
jgi:hypothetical protein